MCTPKKRGVYVLILLLVFVIQIACDGQNSTRQQKAEFSKSVKTEVKLGLHIVPVELDGKKYRFLFDTGAPTSISKDLQRELKYKVIDRGSIVDSDQNKIRVDYVRVDSIVIEGIKFRNVKAFVADFTANPTLACLELDGILGSNLMQACNWQIDYSKEQIHFSNEPFLTNQPGVYSAKFTADEQYDIMLNLKMGKASVSNMKLDYGNNSSITIPIKVMKFLLEEKILTESFREAGYNHGGIGSKPIAMTRYYAYLDSLQVGDLLSTDLKLKTGKSGLIGRDFLSRYIVAINWSEKMLRFKPHKSWADSRLAFGYNIGLNSKGEIVLFGVTENSAASQYDLKVGMRILKVDTLDFVNQHNYCDYINHIDASPDILRMEVEDSEGNIIQAEIARSLLSKKEN